ncbi:hypothetical protein jaqu_34880 [Jannaschia aquimarina]|uniref:Uncharacterized protein n=3 Tax=Jannaschia aquimarina TaxID=935700 RepID=A0A0D1D3Z2_9RHOB|nr:hypothetical protein jaqu_34880 [Jannaschia aquimarina]SNS85242.1 hypothetical protein SAMN05421775_1036 [Jannaschia aquimarina]
MVGTVVAILGIVVAVYLAVRSKQLSHPDFDLRIGEHSVRSQKRKTNPKHLIYLVSMGDDFNLEWLQIRYAIRNTSKKSLNNIHITIDVPSEFCMVKSKINRILTEAGVSELAEAQFFKSRKISGYLRLKRIECTIDTLGPKQQADLAEVLDASNARFPSEIPVPTTLNSIFKCMAQHDEIKAFLPVHMSVSAQDIEPKSEILFVAMVEGNFNTVKAMPRKKRRSYNEGEYEDVGMETPAESINLQNYIDSFWLGRWPAGSWRAISPIRLPWRRRRMMKEESCHIIPVDSDALDRERELNHPHFSGGILNYPISAPNFDYLSSEYNIQSLEELMAHLGFRRPFKNEELIRRLVFICYTGILLAAAIYFGQLF